jgi:tetratricopeptide (TPR) repeat protein
MDDVTMALQHAVDVIPAADPNSAEILTRFALLFEEQFQETDSLECIESAISTMQRAISATREGDLYLAKRFSTLGRFLKDKFLETGKIPDIEQAIVYAQQAFDITTEQPDRSVYLSNVGIYLQEKFGVTDDIADIKKAITCMEDIIKSYPRDQKFPARLLNSLGSMFGDLFKTTGEVKDIDQAIQHTQAAWNLLSPDDPDFGQFSGDLGSLFGDRLEVTGDKQSLEAAMKYAYMAIEKTDEERPSYPIRLNNFGSLLLHQYLKDSRLDDLQKAIEFTEDAVHRSAKHPGRPVFLSNLSSLLGQRFERERKKEDIDTAVNRAREAVSATDKNHPDLPRRMNNLGLLLQGQSKAQAAQDKNQLMEAIEVTSNAVNATSEDDPNLPLRWNNVALLYAAGVEKPEFSVAESSQNWLRNSPVHSQSSSMTMTESSIPEDATDWEEDSDVELCTRVFDANGQAESALSTALDPVKKQMVDRLMEEFWVIFSKNWPAGARQCPGAPTQGHSAEPASASKLSTRISSGETPGGSHTRGNRGEEDPDEGPAKWPGGNGKQPESPPSENQVPPVFACPYRKHNPRKYCVRDWRSCALSPQKTVARVKYATPLLNIDQTNL